MYVKKQQNRWHISDCVSEEITAQIVFISNPFMLLTLFPDPKRKHGLLHKKMQGRDNTLFALQIYFAFE